MCAQTPKLLVVDVAPDGTSRFVFDPALAPLFDNGPATVRRASNVVPVRRWARLVFVALRKLSADTPGDTSWSAQLARRLPGPWRADLSPVNGPVLGPFEQRQQAIDAELEWLHKNWL